MGLIVPTAVEKALKAADESSGPLAESALWSAQMKAAPDPKIASLEERRGAFAEVAAWRFMRPHGGSETEPWGIYWGPLAGGILKDGTPFHQPDVAQVDEEILSHWIRRAETSRHPVIRARYADLAWEIGRSSRAVTALRAMLT
jgi:lysyl-tRNA synthetase class 1